MQKVCGVFGASVLIGLSVCGVSSAQMVDTSFPVPTIDRWMYNFATTPGVEQNISVFTSLNDPNFPLQFDDHDGQFLAVWDTAPAIPAGRPLSEYRIMSATVIARNSRSLGFRYDPTIDAWQSSLPATDPRFVADADLGRPIDMYMVGYRNGWTAGTFAESGPFCSPAATPMSCDSTTLPQRATRNVFAAQYDAGGTLIDISNNVLGPTGVEPGFDPTPLAFGVATPNSAQPNPVNPGDLVPNFTDFTFSVNLSDPSAIRYLREQLASGRLSVIISSLSPSAMQGGNPPRFYTKEAFLQTGDTNRQPARLALRVCVGRPADWDCGGLIDVADIFAFLNDWFAGVGDFNADGASTVNDIFEFLNAWFAG